MQSEDETSSHNITKTKLERTRRRNSLVDPKHGFVTKLEIKENRNLRKTSCTVWYVYPILTLNGFIGKRNVKTFLPPHLEIKNLIFAVEKFLNWEAKLPNWRGETLEHELGDETPRRPQARFFTKHQTESQRVSARN